MGAFLQQVLSCLVLLACHSHGTLAEICMNSTCHYHLEVAWFRTMSYRDEGSRLQQVLLNGTKLTYSSRFGLRELSASDVIVADGYMRNVITINGQFPGPTIEVTEGAKMVVEVSNKLSQRVITVHWHGIYQQNTNYMDGAEGVTQYPILPGQNFTYEFCAQPAGTHFYHAHTATLRLDGLQGLLIVHPRSALPPPIAYHAIALGDWMHNLSEDIELNTLLLCENGVKGPPYKTPGVSDCTFEQAELNPDLYESSLIGGRNRWKDNLAPLSEYNVTQGQRHRFRVVNGGHVFPMEVSIDGHKLTVVASDGHDIEPIVVDSFWIFVAESIDFEIVANQTPGRYWFRANTPCVNSYARAIVSYDGLGDSVATADPVSESISCTRVSKCMVFNCPVSQYPDSYNKTCISMAEARSTLSTDELRQKFGVGDEPSTIQTYFMNWAMVAGSSVNGRRYRMPSIPLSDKDSLQSTDCSGEPCFPDSCQCACTNILELEYNRTVQLVISNLTPNPNVSQHAYHTVHIHGHAFAVMSEQFPEYDNITGHWIRENSDVTCGTDQLCAHPTWSNHSTIPDFSNVTRPPIKDSILLPVRGYVVLRLRTMNPGNWLFHCHVDIHMADGMAIVIRVDPSRLPPPSNGYLTCSGDSSSTTPLTTVINNTNNAPSPASYSVFTVVLASLFVAVVQRLTSMI